MLGVVMVTDQRESRSRIKKAFIVGPVDRDQAVGLRDLLNNGVGPDDAVQMILYPAQLSGTLTIIVLVASGQVDYVMGRIEPVLDEWEHLSH